VKFFAPAHRACRFSILAGLLLIASAGVSPAQNTCPLNSTSGRIKHMIYVQFDNTHFVRDNPNVPSDLEQMPHLLNFLESQGTVLSNHHTPARCNCVSDHFK